MPASTAKCCDIKEPYKLFDRPSEDKLRTPDSFLDEIHRFEGYCKDAKDAIADINDCIEDCGKRATKAEE